MFIRRALTSWPLRTKLLLLILIVFVPAFGIVVEMGLERRSREIDAARESALLTVLGLAAQQEQIAMGTERMLSTLAQLPAVRALQADTCNIILRNLHARNPSYSILALAKPDGSVFAASTPFTPGIVNLSDRKHFRDAIETRSFSAGEYIVGRVSNVKSLNYTYPVLDDEGNLLAVAVAGFKLNEFMRFISKARLPDGYAVTILDHAGVRLFRYPENERAEVGRSVRPEVFAFMRYVEEQGVTEWLGDDGIERFYTFKRLRLRDEASPYLYVSVGLPRDTILRRANFQMVGSLLILGITVVVAVALAWAFGNLVLVGPISRLVEATRRVGEGNMEARTGLSHTPDELGRLAESFDEMASLLETRNSERRKAEEDLARARDELELKVLQRTEAIERINEALRSEIAERTRVEARLRESQEIFGLFMEYSPIYVFFKDSRARPIHLSANFERMLGRPVEEVLGKSMFELFPEELARSMVEDDLAVMKYGQPIHKVEELGGRVYNTIKFPIVRGDGEQALAGFTLDITDQKRMERSLRESEARYRALFESANDAIMVMKGTTLVDCNESTVVLLGAAGKADILGKTPDAFSPETQPDGRFSREAMRDHIEAALAGKPERFLWRGLRMDGTFIDAEVSLRALQLDGETHLQAIARDMTERLRTEAEHKRLEEQLHQARKLEAVGRLAGGVAHDFNNMLGVILGYSELLESRLPADDPLVGHVEEIVKAATRSRDITRQLLAFSRKQIIEPRPVDLNVMIDDTRKALFRLLGEDIDLVFLPAPDLWKIKIDPSQVNQVLVNLGVNARDAMPDGGRLTIETENIFLDETYCGEHFGFNPGHYVLLTVTDEGVGIERDAIEHIFEPFFTTKGVGRGTGLGLATVYGIVRQNGGFINVYSEPGQGTTFKIYLPRMDGDAAHEKQPEPPLWPSGGARLLLVEDDDMMRRMAAEMLEAMGYTVLAAGSPDEAISLCADGGISVDLLLTDVVMPGMSGKDMARRITDLLPGVRVLFMSGYTSNVIAHRGVLDEGVQFIQKPFSMDALARKIEATLGRV